MYTLLLVPRRWRQGRSCWPGEPLELYTAMWEPHPSTCLHQCLPSLRPPRCAFWVLARLLCVHMMRQQAKPGRSTPLSGLQGTSSACWRRCSGVRHPSRCMRGPTQAGEACARACVRPPAPLLTTNHCNVQADVLGAVSLIFWSLTLVVLFKYVVVVLSADHDGEGR